MSSRPWVGCEWRPSPALMTLLPGRAAAASEAGTLLWAWRTTNRLAPMASRLRRVSVRVSPLRVDELSASKLSTSAPSLSAASWNDARVRVEGSKNRLATVRPRSGRCALRPSACGRSACAVSSRRRISSRVSCSRLSRWRIGISAVCQGGGSGISPSQRSTMICAARASSAWASRRRARPSRRALAKRRSASRELERSSMRSTGSP